MKQTDNKETSPWGIIIFFLTYIFSLSMNVWWSYYASRLRNDLDNYKSKYEYVQSYLKTDGYEGQELVSLDSGKNWFTGKWIKTDENGRTLPGWSDLRPASPDLVTKLELRNKLMNHVKSVEDIKAVQDLLEVKP